MTTPKRITVSIDLEHATTTVIEPAGLATPRRQPHLRALYRELALDLFTWMEQHQQAPTDSDAPVVWLLHKVARDRMPAPYGSVSQADLDAAQREMNDWIVKRFGNTDWKLEQPEVLALMRLMRQTEFAPLGPYDPPAPVAKAW